MRNIIFTVIVFFTLNSFAATNPDIMQLKVYKVAVSTSVFCTNPITLFEDNSASYSDFLTSPTIGNGQLSDGTYPCVMIEFSSLIVFSPAANDGDDCAAATTYNLNVCSSGSARLIDGTTVNCTAGDDRIAMYLSTTSTDTSNPTDAFTPPTTISDADRGINLGSALVISGTASAKFVVNGTGNVSDTGASCDMAPPLFSFSKL